MLRQEYANASILHYEVRPQVRKRTTAALRTLGFRRIANVDNADDLINIVKAKKFELVVFAAEADDRRTAKLVKQTRRYGKSSDPYTPMILVSWNSAADVVRRALNTGTDQLLMWPFTAEQLGARVDALINDRRPFIETESYLGPDRRNPKGRGARENSVEVPNALRARVENRPELAPSREAIETARLSLERIKLTNVARRLCMIAKLLRQNQDDEKYMRERAARELAAIDNSLAVVRRSLAVTELEHMNSFCDSVQQVTEQLVKDIPDLDSRGLALLEQTSLALRVALDVDKDTANATLH